MSAPFEDGPAPLRIRVSPTYRVGNPDPHGGLYQIFQFLHVRFEELKRANPWLAHRHWQLSGGEILSIPPAQPARGPSEQPQPAPACLRSFYILEAWSILSSALLLTILERSRERCSVS
jgi:hypothetical protein